MIKTTELMLGNLIEHDGKYHVVEGIGKAHISVSVGNISSDYINPIPLTDGVLKRLEMLGLNDFNADKYPNHDIDYVHKLQIHFYLNPIDITPLLSPRYTTHDNVEVWEGDEVWLVWENGIRPYDNKIDKPTKSNDPSQLNEGALMFSSEQACQSYIDSLTRKPIFTTEDGVDVFEGDSYWYVRDCGYLIDGKTKSSASLGNAYKSYQPIEGLKDFSSPIIAQAYLNKVWAEAEYQSLLNTKK